MVLYDFSIFKAMLEVDYKALHKHDWDNFVVLTGEEGVGKSRLSLWALEIWLNLKYGSFQADDFYKYVGIKVSEYARVLQSVKKGDINICDEAGDVFSGKHALSKLVKKIEDTYTVVRGDNLLTIWSLPTFFMLTPYFRNWRIRSIWYIQKRGLCHVYHKPKRLLLSQTNENTEIKDYFAVPPLFSFVYPDYKGVFLEPYLKMKGAKMQNVRDGFLKIAQEYDDD